MQKRRSEYENWLWGEILLAALLGALLALFLSYPALRTRYDLPQLRLVLQTTMALAGLLVALLAAVRFSVEGRRLDLLLASGFFVISLSSAVFAIGPQLGRGHVKPAEAWAALLGAILGQALIAAAPIVKGRSKYRDWAIANAVAAAGLALFVAWSLLQAAGTDLPALNSPTRGPAAVLPHRHARAAGVPLPRLRRRLERAVPPARRRPRELARARIHADALRVAALRVPAAARAARTCRTATSCACSRTG